MLVFLVIYEFYIQRYSIWCTMKFSLVNYIFHQLICYNSSGGSLTVLCANVPNSFCNEFLFPFIFHFQFIPIFLKFPVVIHLICFVNQIKRKKKRKTKTKSIIKIHSFTIDIRFTIYKICNLHYHHKWGLIPSIS